MNFWSISQCLIAFLALVTVYSQPRVLYKSIQEIDNGEELNAAQINDFIMKNWDALGGYEKTEEDILSQDEEEAMAYLAQNGHKEVPNYKTMMELMQKRISEKNAKTGLRNETKKILTPTIEEKPTAKFDSSDSQNVKLQTTTSQSSTQKNEVQFGSQEQGSSLFVGFLGASIFLVIVCFILASKMQKNILQKSKPFENRRKNDHETPKSQGLDSSAQGIQENCSEII